MASRRRYGYKDYDEEYDKEYDEEYYARRRPRRKRGGDRPTCECDCPACRYPQQRGGVLSTLAKGVVKGVRTGLYVANPWNQLTCTLYFKAAMARVQAKLLTASARTAAGVCMSSTNIVFCIKMAKALIAAAGTGGAASAAVAAVCAADVGICAPAMKKGLVEFAQVLKDELDQDTGIKRCVEGLTGIWANGKKETKK